VMNNSILKLGNVVKADPAVQNVIAYTGGGGATNGGSINIALKPLGKQCKESLNCSVRQTGAPEIINRLRPKLNRLPVASAFLQAAQDLRIGGTVERGALPIHHPIGQRAGPGALGPTAVAG